MESRGHCPGENYNTIYPNETKKTPTRKIRERLWLETTHASLVQMRTLPWWELQRNLSQLDTHEKGCKDQRNPCCHYENIPLSDVSSKFQQVNGLNLILRKSNLWSMSVTQEAGEDKRERHARISVVWTGSCSIQSPFRGWNSSAQVNQTWHRPDLRRGLGSNSRGRQEAIV